MLSRIGVQGLLVALGALSLAVAGVVFLVVAWDRLSLGARALVVAAITAAAMGGAAWLRRRLPETAEAIGGLAVVLVLADAWAVRATGLLGADRISGLAYATAACAGCALILLAWGAAARVRAGSIAGCVAGPVTPLLAGLWLSSHVPEPSANAIWAGGAVAALVTTGRRWTPTSWRPERVVLRAGGLVATLQTVGGAWYSLGIADVHPGSLVLASALVVLAAVLQPWADHTHSGDFGDGSDPGAAPSAVTTAQRAGWSAVTGAATAATAGALAHLAARAGEGVGLDHQWWLATAPPAAMAAAWALLRLTPRLQPTLGLATRPTASAARVAAVVLCLPGGVEVLRQVVTVVAAAAARPWSQSATAPLSRLIAQVAELAADPWILLAAVVGLVGAALLLAGSRPHRWALVVAGLAGLALAGAVTLPPAPIAVAVAAQAVVAVACAVVAVRAGGRHPLIRPSGLVTAAVIGVLAVTTAWSVPELSVPASLGGVVALIVARGPVNPEVQPAVRPMFAAVAVTTVAVIAGAVAGLLGAAMIDRVTVVAVASAVLVGVCLAVPVPPLDGTVGVRAERWAGAVAGVVAYVPGFVAASGLGTVAGPGVWWRGNGFAPPTVTLLLGVLTVAAAAGAAWPARETSPAGPRAPVVAAAAAVPLAVGVVAGAVETVARAQGLLIADRFRVVVLSAGAALVVVAAGLAVVGLRRPRDLRRLPAEVGAAAAAVLTLLAGVSAWDPAWLWLLCTFLGAAVAAAAVPADRRPLAWGSWVLLTAASWLRLQVEDVGLLEAYTVPPALVLLVVAGLRLRRDREAAAVGRLVPGLGLALLPSVLATVSGSAWRPATLLVLGAIGVVVAARWLAATAWRQLGLLALRVGAATAGGAGLLRSVAAVRGAHDALAGAAPGASGAGPQWWQVESWSIAGALVLVAAALVALSAGLVPVRWRSAVGLPAFVLAVGPTLYAALPAPEWWFDWPERAAAARAGAVLTGAGVLAVLRARFPRAVLLSRLLARTASVTVLVAAAIGVATDVGVVEVWTASAGVVFLVVGVLGLRRIPALRSWRVLGPGVVLLLVPSQVLTLGGGPLWRVLALAVASTVIVVVGAVARLQAPVVLGGGVLAVHAVAQLGPWLAHAVATVPRWVTFGVIGIALLALGATYERRLRDLRTLRLRVNALR